MTVLLRVDALGIRIGGDRPVDLVRGVGFEIAPGERLGVIGESGSGKSLTALAVLGLLAHPLEASGRIEVATDGGVVDVLTARQKRLDRVRGSIIGAVFQEPLSSLDPLMRVGKQLGWPIAHHRGLRGGALDRAVLDALADVQLTNPERIARSYIHEISGGQRQRVAIAIALAARPQLLIADEPTTALDVTVQAGVLDLLDRAVAERGMSLMFISHDLPVVSRMSDRVLVMRGGDQVELGGTAQILQQPREEYTKTLVASSRALDRFLPELVDDGRGPEDARADDGEVIP
jgi:peptide/nickel transport system ATP-binding protein